MGESQIAYSGRKGVTLLQTSGAGNVIQDPNLIFFNTDLAIDLGDDGITPNDPLDSDVGPNNYQNYPEITSAFVSGGSTNIVGVLSSSPNTIFQLEFFGSSTAGLGGSGQGEEFLGQTMVTTNSLGQANFSFSFPVVFGSYASATATAPDGSTSEFSLAVTISGAGGRLGVSGRGRRLGGVVTTAGNGELGGSDPTLLDGGASAAILLAEFLRDVPRLIPDGQASKPRPDVEAVLARAGEGTASFAHAQLATRDSPSQGETEHALDEVFSSYSTLSGEGPSGPAGAVLDLGFLHDLVLLGQHPG